VKTRLFGKAALVILACLLTFGAQAADKPPKPLTEDDVVLLLIGGATTDKMIEIIEDRGISFQMNPDVAKRFHDAGADDRVIEALQKAMMKASAAPSTTEAKTEAKADSKEAETQPAATPAAEKAAEEERPEPKTPGLADPSPAQIEGIIQAFAAKEKIFKEARDNYTYHQINKVQQLDPDGDVVGVYQQEWDILYDDNGGRIERVTYAPPDTLKGLMVTKEDLESMRNVQPFVLTSDELPEYDIKYLGHVKVDYITAYVFSIRPKELVKGRVYFQGRVWVDDRDLQIVKSEGKTVPETKTSKHENLFPRFTTYREQIDGKFWFPTFTMADDTLYFANGPIHIKQVIKYTDYKQFRSTTKMKVLAEVPSGESKSSGTAEKK
jgi:ribosomal protein L12E/L44/L45/RPP1/RPP2